MLQLSIIIPCYNMGNTIQETIASVLSFPDQSMIELIIINDGSDDDGFTQSILDQYDLPNLVIIHQENEGLGKARNTGIKRAVSPYVLLLDADNHLRHEYITMGLEIMSSQNDVAVVYSDLNHFGTQNGLVKVGEFDISKLLVKNYIDACVMLRKSAWGSIGGYDEKMPIMGYEDWDLHLRLFFKGWEFYYLPVTGFDYRVRDDSMLKTSNQYRDSLIEYMFAKEELLQASKLRQQLAERQSYFEALESIQKRTLMKWSLKLEHRLKQNKDILSILKGLLRPFK